MFATDFKTKLTTNYQLVEASPKTDHFVQTQMKAYYGQLKDFLYTHADEMVYAALAMEQTPQPNTAADLRKSWFWTTEGTLLVNGKKVFRDAPEMDFWIWFQPHGKHSGHMAFNKQFEGPLILFSVLKGLFDPDHLASRLSDDLFTHEVTHHFDTQRQGKVKNHSGQALKKGDLKGYFNDPFEYNAYYQEGLSTLHSLLEMDRIPDDKKKDLLGNFEDFKTRTFKQNFAEAFLTHLEPKFKQKLVKRLYGFWKFHHDRLKAKEV